MIGPQIYGWRRVACASLIAISTATFAADIAASRTSDLLEWIRQIYEAVRNELEDKQEREAKAWLLQEKRKAETEAIRACENAVNLRVQIACIERRSDAFTDRYRKRATPEELRFVILTKLQDRLTQDSRPTDNGMSLVKQVSDRCTSEAVPRAEQSKCLQHAQDCARIGIGSPEKSKACLQELDALILSQNTSQRKPKGGECAIFDDPIKSDALAASNPERHMKLLQECN